MFGWVRRSGKETEGPFSLCFLSFLFNRGKGREGGAFPQIKIYDYTEQQSLRDPRNRGLSVVLDYVHGVKPLLSRSLQSVEKCWLLVVVRSRHVMSRLLSSTRH